VSKHAYRWVRIPDYPRTVWVLETRIEARRLRDYLLREYGIDPKTVRIRAYVPDPFLNRDRRVSR
jgi:NADPH-dependent ferric siderophore reductase